MPNNVLTLLFIPVMIIAFYFLLIRPQRKRQQEQQKLLREMTAGARVVTHSGIFGTLVSLGDKQAVIEIAPGVHLTVLRQAVVRTVGPADEDGPADADESAAESEDGPADTITGATAATPDTASFATPPADRTSAAGAPATPGDEAAAAPGFPAYRPADEAEGSSDQAGSDQAGSGPAGDEDGPDGGIRDVTDSYFARPRGGEGDRAPGDA